MVTFGHGRGPKRGAAAQVVVLVVLSKLRKEGSGKISKRSDLNCFFVIFFGFVKTLKFELIIGREN